MMTEITQAIERLADPARRDWYEERCARAPRLEAQLVDIACDLGLSLEIPRSRFALNATAQDRFVDLQPSPVKFELGEFRANYSAGLTASVLADVYWITYIIEVDNASPRGVRMETDLR